MNALDRYQSAQESANARISSALELRLFTCIFGFLFLMSFVAGAVFVVVFSDSSSERWLHLWQSFFVIAMLGVISVYFSKRERREPLPLSTRRFILRSIVFIYIAIVIAFTILAFSPLARGTNVFITLIRLGAALPLPVMAWQIQKRMKVENQQKSEVSQENHQDKEMITEIGSDQAKPPKQEMNPKPSRQKKTEANQTPEPTSGTVTIPAAQEVAPVPPVARL